MSPSPSPSPPSPLPSDRMFIADLGYSLEFGASTSRGVLDVTEELRVPGTGYVRASVLGTMADTLAGMLAGEHTNPSFPLTLDMTIRNLAPTDATRLDMAAGVVKAGRTTIVTEAEFTEARTRRLVANVTLTFVPSAPPVSGSRDVYAVRREPKGLTPTAMARPFAEQVGARVIEPGVVEIAHHPYVVQSTGTIQGGIVALLGELAAESVLGRPIVELEARYLRSIHTGPGRTATNVLTDDLVRVDVCDAGNGGRVGTLVIARA